VHRDSLAKEPLHVLLGITPEGNREVLQMFDSDSQGTEEQVLGEAI
jgi:transposase-like protein